MQTFIFKYHYTESGFCRVHYIWKNKDNNELYYCLMDNGYSDVMDVELFRCSQDGEPDYKVNFKSEVKLEFETPPDTYGQELLKQFLNRTTKT